MENEVEVPKKDERHLRNEKEDVKTALDLVYGVVSQLDLLHPGVRGILRILFHS